MKIGLEGDKRKFQKATKAQLEAAVTYGIGDDEITQWPQCYYCKMDIKERPWTDADGHTVCFRCYNETFVGTADIWDYDTDDFYDEDFVVEDFL